MSKSESDSRDPRVSVVPDPFAKMFADAGLLPREADAEGEGMVETGESRVFDPPYVEYKRGLDWLIFLREECSYRSEPAHPFLDVLRHPHEQRLVGIKLIACSPVFRQIKRAMRLADGAAIRLASVLEIIYLARGSVTGPGGVERVERLHSEALKVAGDFEINLP